MIYPEADPAPRKYNALGKQQEAGMRHSAEMQKPAKLFVTVKRATLGDVSIIPEWQSALCAHV